MKAIILAGGLGTRISEETADKPKPMVDIADKPMLWHIMNIFACQGVTEFVIATGYKGEVIESWIKTVDEPWKIEALNTGLNTQTGGRIREGGAVGLVDTYNLDRVSREGSINDKALSTEISR
jgi:glucose-1-phosphate cytidylyltransferase